MREALLKSLVVSVVKQRKWTNSGYQAEAWSAALSAVKAAAPGSRVTLAQIRRRHYIMKSDWHVWRHMICSFGFGVEGGPVTCSGPAVDDYFQRHKKARNFRYKPLEFPQEHRQLFDGDFATGVLDPRELRDFSRDAYTSAEETESDSAASGSLAEASTNRAPTASLTRRKRTATKARTATSRKQTAADRLAEKLGQTSAHLGAFVAVLNKDYPSEALELFFEGFRELDYRLKLAVADRFECEYTAKMFTLLRPGRQRKSWVRTELQREAAAPGEDGRELRSLLDAVDWDKIDG